MDVLSTQGMPGQFATGDGFDLTGECINVSSTEELSDPELLARLSAPFAPYLEEELPRRPASAGYDVVGLNITYRRQLPLALHMARVIKDRLPDALLLVGGTEASDVWKYLEDKRRFFDVLAAVDVCVIGEGKSAFCDILRARARGELPQPSANVQLNPRRGGTGRRELLSLCYENTTTIPTPAYDKLPSHLYLSPHRFVYYSPSRGC
ncbi:hypothetical protein GCM10010145_61090 [Streptomyces ruber]|uniref:B12-binding domain-containing protein n=2 Tax=Streptomyces TaxID=1883 RepID=A0A918EWR2_9ACTN|nr:cobalamin B12-binding domain-containing protein [Streptomyces ruber]GGQ83179.1 hypothetical protein GCM10010145_61090 [Streptomyces ruber]